MCAPMIALSIVVNSMKKTNNELLPGSAPYLRKEEPIVYHDYPTCEKCGLIIIDPKTHQCN